MKTTENKNLFMGTLYKFKKIGILILGTFILACGDSSESISNKDLQKMVERQEQIEKMLERIESQTRFIALKVGWEDPNAPAAVIPKGDSYSQGTDKPVLTLVEFSDFECPYCAQAAPVLDKFVQDHSDKVQLIFKHFPLSFHKKAMSAHIASLAAGEQGRFFEYRYKIAPHFRRLGDSLYTAAAQELGLDMDAFEQAMGKSQEMQSKVQADIRLGRRVGVSGTPTLFANGRLVRDRSYQGLVALLEEVESK